MHFKIFIEIFFCSVRHYFCPAFLFKKCLVMPNAHFVQRCQCQRKYNFKHTKTFYFLYFCIVFFFTRILHNLSVNVVFHKGFLKVWSLIEHKVEWLMQLSLTVELRVQDIMNMGNKGKSKKIIMNCQTTFYRYCTRYFSWAVPLRCEEQIVFQSSNII